MVGLLNLRNLDWGWVGAEDMLNVVSRYQRDFPFNRS